MTTPRTPQRLGAVALDFARRELAVLLAVALLAIFALWPEPAAALLS